MAQPCDGPESKGNDARDSGVVFTWGSGHSGELGHEEVDKEGECPLPTRVPGLTDVVAVACGEATTGAVTAAGELYMWGQGRGGRLGHGNDESCKAPRQVAALSKHHVQQLSIGEGHVGCIADGGTLWMWGKGGNGALGTGATDNRNVPTLVIAAAVRQVSCGHQYTLAVKSDGALLSWGHGAYGKHGLGHSDDVLVPSEVASKDAQFRFVAAGSVCSAAISTTGQLYTWGFGGTGCLGHGNRKSHTQPQAVEALAGVNIVHVRCTVGQINPPKPTRAGHEGPHTVAVSDVGSLYTFGTCHKGILGNLKDKTLIADHDQLSPYLVGSVASDHPDDGPTGYLAGEKVVAAVSSAIHTGLLTASGKVLCMGCGSTGRMGVRRYLEGLTGHKSRMKCYISAPTEVAVLGDLGAHALQLDTSRRHMVALVRL